MPTGNPLTEHDTFEDVVFSELELHGADLSVYSLTKYAGGHSDLVAGGITGSKDLINTIRMMRNTIGISPFLVILSVLIGGAAAGLVGALLAVPIAAVGEVLIEGFQARETPVAQDPTATETTKDESNAADEPDAGTGAIGSAHTSVEAEPTVSS